MGIPYAYKRLTKFGCWYAALQAMLHTNNGVIGLRPGWRRTEISAQQKALAGWLQYYFDDAFDNEFQMTIEEIENILTDWSIHLTNKQKRYIHFNSFTNFIFHFRNLPNEKVQDIVLLQLNDYVREIKEHNATFKSSESYDLATRYMTRLSDIYSSHLNFRSIMELRFLVLFSIIGDGIFFLLLRDRLSFYFPIVSLSLFTYYFVRKISLEKKKKLFGLFY